MSRERESTGSADQSQAFEARPGGAFALLAAVQLVLIFAITVIAVPLPAIQSELDLNRSELAFLSAAYGLAFGGLLLLGGRLADRFGWRRSLRLGLALFGAGSLGGMAAPGFIPLAAMRFVQGVGGALAAPAAMALAGSLFTDPGRRRRAMAIWGTLPATGATLGILLSGFIATWLSWRWIFFIPAVFAALGVWAAPRLLPQGPGAVGRKLDALGAVLVTAGATSLSYGLVMTQTQPWHSAQVLGFLIAGAGFGAAFLAVEAHTDSPLVPLRFVFHRRRATALFAVWLAAAAHSTTSFLLSLYFQQVRGFSPFSTSLAFLPFALILVTGPIAARLIARIGSAGAAASGMTAAAAGLWMLGQLEPTTPYAGLFLAGVLLMPLGIGLTLAGGAASSMDGVADSEAALAGGIVNMAIELGPTVGLAVLLSLAGAYAAGAAGLEAAHAVTAGYGFALRCAALAFTFGACAAALALRRGPAASPSYAGASAEDGRRAHQDQEGSS